MAITKDQVFAIADQMFQDGIAPTLISLRAALGTGSYSTIAGFLSEWKAASRGDVVQEIDMPVELEPVAMTFARSYWSACHKLAQETIVVLMKENDLKLHKAETAQHDAYVVAEQVQQDFDALFKENVKLVDLLEETRGKAVEAENRAIVSESLYAQLKVILESLTDAKAIKIQPGIVKPKLVAKK